MLSQDGILRFIDIHACKQLFEIGGADEVHSKFICAVMYSFPAKNMEIMICTQPHKGRLIIIII